MVCPVVAWHFICGFLASEQGLFLPDVNADSHYNRCILQIYFNVKEKDEFSIFLCTLPFGFSLFRSDLQCL